MKSPLTLKTVNERVNIEIDLPSLFFIWGLATCTILVMIILCSCIFTFDCSEFMPTLSYLGAFTFYDRALVWITTAQTLPLGIFFTSSFVVNRQFFNCMDSYTLLFMGLGVAVAIPSVFIVDEVNSSYYFPFDRIHLIILCSLMMVIGIWMLFSLELIYKMYRNNPRKILVYVAAYILLCFISALYSSNLWINAYVPKDYIPLALSEYFCVGLFSFLPRVYFCAYDQMKIVMGQGKILKIDN